MRRLMWALAGGCIALGGLFGVGTAGVASAAGRPGAHTCANETLAAGTYTSLQVTGFCSLPDSGTVTVLGNVTVAPGATFNAATPATLVIGGNLHVGSGAILGLGCSPEVGCEVNSYDRVGGNLIATNAAMVIVHNATIRGNVSQHGGGGTMDCQVASPIGAPYYSDYEDTVIGGNTIVTGLRTCWFGYVRTQSGGNVSLHNNVFGDPDADEIVTNVIQGNLICTGNSPAPQVGDSMGAPNVVLGRKIGQCANIH